MYEAVQVAENVVNKVKEVVTQIEVLETVAMDEPRWVVVVNESDLWRSVARACTWVLEAVQKAENVDNNLK